MSDAAELIDAGRRGALQEAACVADEILSEASFWPNHLNAQYEREGWEKAAKKIAKAIRAKLTGDQAA